MRFAPTSALFTAAAIVALALVGCASTDDDGEPEQPTTVPESTESTSASQEKRETTKTGDRPDFAPQFDTNAPTKEDKKEPTASGASGGTPAPGSVACTDDDDAASTPALAKKLPETDDCNQEMLAVKGVLNGGVDTDYYSLSALDKGISFSHPVGCKLDSAFETKTPGTEICVFARCKNSTEDTVTGCAEGKEATSENGWKGCCGTRAIPQMDCSGFTDNDSSDFLIRIKSTTNEANSCQPYRFEYRF